MSLEELKEGSFVALFNGEELRAVLEIHRVTKTQLVVIRNREKPNAREQKFRRSSGSGIEDRLVRIEPFNESVHQPMLDALRQDNARCKLAAELKHKLHGLTLDQLQRMSAIAMTKGTA